MPEKVASSKLNGYIPVIIFGLSIPLAFFMWMGNVAFTKLIRDSEYDENVGIPPMRLLFSTSVSLALMIYALKRNSVNKSGAALGIVVSIICSIASHAFLGSLMAFFLTSSRATKFKEHMKRKIESDFKEGGQRNWIQVLCNGGMATQLALLYLLDCGCGERPIDFSTSYRCSWLGIGVLSSYACCSGDTWASELGTVLSKSEPFLITTGKRVPRGTNGGITIIGLLVSYLGGLVVGLVYYLIIVYTSDPTQILTSPAQYPIIICGGIGGLLGSLIDSVLGATIQYSGITPEGRIVEKPGKNVKHISGLSILDNHSVNLISCIITALLMPMIAAKIWPEI